MPAQVRRATGSIGSVFALLISGATVDVTASAARATDCLAAPNSTAPANSHWFYHTDRTQQRKCWYLRAADQASQQADDDSRRETAPVRAAPSVPPANAYSLADFKNYIAHRVSTNVPDQDVEKLYAEFLEWRRRAAN
jgi:hypothetical protein